jgi:hypothetical protein
MFGLLTKPQNAFVALLAATFVVGITLPARGQTVAFGRPSRDCCLPAPCGTLEIPTAQGTTPPVIPPDGQPPSALAFQTPDERFAGRASISYPMIGDMIVPSGGSRTVLIVSQATNSVTAQTFRIPAANHGFKIAENDSPIPVDRVFVNYNYFNNVNGSFDAATGAPIGRIDVHRQLFGVEKTFFNGDASVELRVPVDQLDAMGGSVPGLGGSFTDFGDLTVLLKGVLLRNNKTGNVLSAGLGITMPTGPSTFAGVPPFGNTIVIPAPPPPPPPPQPPSTFFAPAHTVTVNGSQFSSNSTIDPGFVSDHNVLLHPIIGGLYNVGNAYVQATSALDIPLGPNDVTLMYNDFAVGYYLYRDRTSDRILTAVIPTFEVHVNTPLNHRGSMNGNLGTPDWVDLTAGTIVEFCRRSTISAGVCAPVTGAKPFDVEGIVQLNFRF